MLFPQIKNFVITVAILMGLGSLSACQSTPPLTSETSDQSTLIKGVNYPNIYSLAFLPNPERISSLQTIVKEFQSISSPNPEEKLVLSQGRYLLALDFLSIEKPHEALQQLEGLENLYPLLSPAIISQRAQAYQLIGDQDKAQKNWQELLEKFPDHPIAVEALYHLGKNQPDYWEKAINQFPSHPLTIEIAQKKLKENPAQPELLFLIAQHGLSLKNYGDYVEQLKQKYGNQLSPKQWEIIAWGSWEKQDYGKAAIAYGKATKTPKNLYRHGRGLWLDGKIFPAKKAYQTLIKEFPNAEETGLGLLRLSRIDDNKNSIIYLDKIIKSFPKHAPEALLDKSKLLDKMGSSQLASQTRQLLLRKYSKSDAAAELRWSLAKQAEQVRELKIAWKWAQELTQNNPHHELAPKAGFWIGKWAQKLGLNEESKQAFERVITSYPSSYFAWRSAVLLGWSVGDFTTLKSFSPKVVRPQEQPLPLAGSELMKELYRFGEEKEAWTLWQVEFKTPQNPTVSEQFTDGLMRLGIGDNLDGLWMISSLNQRENPEEKKEVLELQKQATYWEALYPFPYLETIVQWSQKRQLNPLLVTALIRQESRFMPNIKSPVGATGLMQVMPDTGAWIAEKINLKKYSLNNINDNINLGTWYLDYTHDEYKNNSLLAVASYNAGPGAVGGWVDRFGFQDPDVFVEKIPFPETQGYVKSVFENYWNYLRIYNPEISQKLEQHITRTR